MLIKKKQRLKHNSETFIHLLFILIGFEMLLSISWNFITKINIVLLYVTVVLLLFVNKEIQFHKTDLPWVLAYIYIIFNVRSFNGNIVVYLCYFTIGIVFFIIGQRYYSIIYNSFKILAPICLISGIFCIAEVLFPGFVHDFFSLLSDNLYSKSIRNASNGRYLGLTGYVWYIVWFAVIFIGYFFSASSQLPKKNRIFYSIIALVLFVSLIFSGSRSSIFLIPLCVLFAYKERRVKRFLLIIVIAFVLYEAFRIFYASGSNTFRFFYKIQQVINTFMNGNELDLTRKSLKDTAIQYFNESPIFGIGWFEFSIRGVRERGLDSYTHVHNLYYQLMSECGIVGGVIILFPFVSTYIVTIKEVFSNRVKNKSIIRFGLFVQTYIFISSWLHVTIYNEITILMYFIIICMTMGFINLQKTKVVGKSENE